jgi:hypothetical protein
MAQPLYPLVPTGEEAEWAQSWSEHGGEKKNSQPLPGLKPLIMQPLAQHYTAELPQLPRNTALNKIQIINM